MLEIPKGKSFDVVLFGGRIFTAPAKSQVFSFEVDNKPTLYFCIARLIELRDERPEQWETIEIPLDSVAIIVTQRGVDVDHAMRMSIQRVNEPGYGVFMPDGSFLIVDGSHRYVRRAFDGRDGMIFHTCRAPDYFTALINSVETKRLWGI